MKKIRELASEMVCLKMKYDEEFKSLITKEELCDELEIIHKKLKEAMIFFDDESPCQSTPKRAESEKNSVESPIMGVQSNSFSKSGDHSTSEPTDSVSKNTQYQSYTKSEAFSEGSARSKSVQEQGVDYPFQSYKSEDERSPILSETKKSSDKSKSASSKFVQEEGVDFPLQSYKSPSPEEVSNLWSPVKEKSDRADTYGIPDLPFLNPYSSEAVNVEEEKKRESSRQRCAATVFMSPYKARVVDIYELMSKEEWCIHEWAMGVEADDL